MQLYTLLNSNQIDALKLLKEKTEEIWLSPVTKNPTPTEQSKKHRNNIKTPPKTSITQLLRTDLGRSVGVTAVTQLVWRGHKNVVHKHM